MKHEITKDMIVKDSRGTNIGRNEESSTTHKGEKQNKSNSARLPPERPSINGILRKVCVPRPEHVASMVCDMSTNNKLVRIQQPRQQVNSAAGLFKDAEQPVGKTREA